MPRGKSVLVSAVMALIVATSGCGGDGDVDEAQEFDVDEAQEFDAGCNESFPIAMTPVPETPEEEDYVDDFVVCTDGEFTSIENDSPAVWRLSTVGGFTRSQDDGDQAFFRTLTSSFGKGELLLPNSTVVVAAAPGSVSWDIDGSLSAGWAFQSAASEVVGERARSELSDLFDPSSPRGKALKVCVLSAYQVWDQRQALRLPTSAEDLIAGVGLVGDATQCRREWTNADDAARAGRGEAATTTVDDLSRGLLTTSKARTRFDLAVSTVSRWVKSGRVRLPGRG